MKQSITIFALLITTLLTSCCQQTAPSTHTTLSAPDERTSVNVYIQNDRVWCYYKLPPVQITLYFCNEVDVEMDGYINRYPAKVFQVGPLEWVAELPDSNYIRLNARTGVATTRIRGENRTFAPEFIKKTQL